MVSSRKLLVSAAALAAPTNAVLTPAQIVGSIQVLTTKSQLLQAPAQSITILNAPLVIVGLGPFPVRDHVCRFCHSRHSCHSNDGRCRIQRSLPLNALDDFMWVESPLELQTFQTSSLADHNTANHRRFHRHRYYGHSRNCADPRHTLCTSWSAKRCYFRSLSRGIYYPSHRKRLGIANRICVQFVRVHQVLLNILIGKAVLFNTVPVIGAPVAAILRQIEKVVDVSAHICRKSTARVLAHIFLCTDALQTIAYGLINLVQSRASDLTLQANALSSSIETAIDSYDGIPLLKREELRPIDDVYDEAIAAAATAA